MNGEAGPPASRGRTREIERLELLVRISEALNASLDIGALGALGDLLVPSFADICAIDVINRDGSITRIATTHAEPSKRPLVDTLGRFLPRLAGHPAIAEVVATGTPLLAETLDDDMLLIDVDDPDHVAAIRGLRIRSGMVIPMRGRDRTVGVITLARTADSGRVFGGDDLRLAEDIAHLTALAAENAMLMREIEGSRERYRMLVDSVDAIVWEADPSTLALTFVSERAEKLLGYPISRWLDDTGFFEHIVVEDDRAWVLEQRLTAIASGDDHEMEYRVTTADGRTVWLHDRLYVERGLNGPAALRGLMVDVTERKLAETRQRAHLATARVFAEATSPVEIPAGVLRALLDTLGWDAGAVWQVASGRDALRCIEFVHVAGVHVPAFEAATWRSEFTTGIGLPGRVLASGGPAWIEDVTEDPDFPRADAAARSGLRGAFAFPVLAEGRVQGVLELFTRATQRPDESLMHLVGGVGVQMGQFIRRRELQEELRHSEARTRAIIESALDAIITMDASGRITGINPRAAELFGLEPDAAVGLNMAETIIPPSLREAHRSGLARFLKTGRPKVIGERREMTGLRSDGTEFPIELSIAIRSEGAEPMFIGFMRDMTEQRIAEQEAAFQRTLLASQSEASIDGILVVSPENRILSRNRRFAELWDIPEELLDDGATLRTIIEKVADPEEARTQIRYLERHPEAVDRREVLLADGRTFDRYTTPLIDEDGVRYGRMWTFRDITEQKRAERALLDSTARSNLLAEVSAALVKTADPVAMLMDIARLSVPRFADWCAVDLVREDETLERVALVHRDTEMAGFVEQLRTRTLSARLDPEAPRGVSRVIRTGLPELEPDVPDAWLVEAARGHQEMLAVLRGLGLRSYLCVPLNARGLTIGAITFVAAGSGRRYDSADLWLAEDLGNRVAIAIETARLHEETHHVATTLQQSLIPPSLPEIPGVEVAARFEPAGRSIQVGGDFYDLFSTGRNDWAIVMGDVCGKGADAAAITVLARYTIRASAMQTKRPHNILTQLNEALIRQRGDERYCTVAYGRLRTSRGIFRLTSSSGGHPLPLVLRASGEVQEIGLPGMILGAFAEISLKEQTVALQPGDCVVFYTDGVTEAGSPEHMIGEAGVMDLLLQLQGASSREVADSLVESALTRASGESRDDIAVVVVKILGAKGTDGGTLGR